MTDQNNFTSSQTGNTSYPLDNNSIKQENNNNQATTTQNNSNNNNMSQINYSGQTWIDNSNLLSSNNGLNTAANFLSSANNYANYYGSSSLTANGLNGVNGLAGALNGSGNSEKTNGIIDDAVTSSASNTAANTTTAATLLQQNSLMSAMTGLNSASASTATGLGTAFSNYSASAMAGFNPLTMNALGSLSSTTGITGLNSAFGGAYNWMKPSLVEQPPNGKWIFVLFFYHNFP